MTSGAASLAGGTRVGTSQRSVVVPWLAVLGAVGVVALDLFLSSRIGLGFADRAGEHVHVLPFACVGALVLYRQPRHPIGVVLVLIALALPLAGSFEAAAVLAIDEGMRALASWLALPTRVLWLPHSVLFAIQLPLRFPDGQYANLFGRRVGRLSIAVACVAAGSEIVNASQSRVGMDDAPRFVANPLGVPAIEGFAGMLAAVCFFALVFLGALSIGSFLRRYRQAEGLQRLQFRWVGVSLGLFAVGVACIPLIVQLENVGVLNEAPTWVTDLFLGVPAALFPVGIGVAVTRYRLWEIDRLLSRTLSYAVIVAVLAGAYLGLVVAIGAATRALTGESTDLTVALSTLVVAALFQPVRGRVRAVLDRRFHRARYDAAGIVDDFGRRLRDELDLDRLAADLAEVARRTMQPRHAGVWTATRTSGDA